MTRRFLTAEDVRHATERTIVVDAETIVTPQALDAAEAAGIDVRTEEGPWSEPTPDRGPDAQRAAARSSHLPEPEGAAQLSKSAIVTAVGINRPGVLADLAVAIAEQGANVLDVSQRIVGGYFHMILTVELSGATSFEDFQNRLQCMSNPDDFAVRVMNERVFRFMHRV